MQHVAVALDLGLKIKRRVKYTKAIGGALIALLLTPPFSVDQVVVLVPQRFRDPREYSSLVLRLTQV
ncbi:MAG TPA: hypothetical protein VE242_03720 [Chthoniobacterales bacterium]|nr:hypothetical protein [Chthoniobacterales bacterium]